MSKALYKFHWDCGRMGGISGLFVADTVEIDRALGEEVYFGQVLGKHSEIFGTLDPEDIQVATDDQEFIAKLVEIFGSPLISGLNPLHYMEVHSD